MKKFVSILFISFIASFTFAQTDKDIVLEVAGENISKKTFIEMYQRNNPNPDKKIIKKDLEEYLNLFINFKLKLAQARKLGYDTLSTYVEEVNTYRKQLIEPYLNDKTVTEELIKEAYDRTKEIIRASHILILIPTNATPKDTLEAYNKALEIRKKIFNGEDFGELAVQFSEDPSAKDQQMNDGQNKIKGNRGDLGYFTSFSMIYPFETACYSLKINEVSKPIRSQRGYHIIKLTDRKNIIISGIKKINSFDEKEFDLDSVMGSIIIKGSNLEMIKLDTIEGNVSIKGQINSFTYSDTNDKESSILAKLFKWNN